MCCSIVGVGQKTFYLLLLVLHATNLYFPFSLVTENSQLANIQLHLLVEKKDFGDRQESPLLASINFKECPTNQLLHVTIITSKFERINFFMPVFLLLFLMFFFNMYLRPQTLKTLLLLFVSISKEQSLRKKTLICYL